MTSSLKPLTSDLVARYAARFNAAFATGTHTVTSPLGAWLLLALVGPASEGETRARLEAHLGTTVDDARARAGVLLEVAHPAVASACALWFQRESLLAKFDDWRATLPDVVAAGPIPTQDEADSWAEDNTLGRIDKFPRIGPAAIVVLATALVTKVLWETPFTPVPGDRLEGEWSRRVSKALMAPKTHRVVLVDTDVAGVVAMHAERSRDGLLVASVIAEPEVPPAVALEAAHDAALVALHRPVRARALSLFDVPLEGHAWRITETMRPSEGGTESYEAILPAWSATADHDLLEMGVDVGFSDAVEAMTSLCSPEWPIGGEAKQVARASYAATGFEAAAITTVLLSRGMSDTASVRVRRAHIRFNRPYAAVALAVADGNAPQVPRDAFPWHGVPVFGAWVAEPGEA